MPKEIKDETKYIKLPFLDYLNDLLGNVLTGLEKHQVKPLTGEIIKSLDSAEEFVHVQFETFEGEPLANPIVWRIKPWRDSLLKWRLDKEKSAKERREANLRDENTVRLNKKLKELTAKYGVDISDPIVANALQFMARKNAIKKNKAAAEALGTFIETDES